MSTGEIAPDQVWEPESKGQRTRRRILEAARRTFGELGYERATIRAIAAEADVDKSSVIQYFGTKQQLFRESLDFGIDIDSLTTDDPGRSAENLLRAMLERWAAAPDSPMAVLLRTSMTSEEAAQMLREHVTSVAIDRIAPGIHGPDARLRAALAGAVMFGITVHRHLLRMPDLAEADLDDVLRLAVPLIRSLLDADTD
ncbi:TetR/AcrR family transcriptional regulator [Nonomuraea sp. NEAU-A123]|uniref:TetR/AcrR family transcriptional regulator n=1 Tax=Nonomuraea sp. NEAU-A123 TaxID=2839649 RepID=UPI001BE4DCD1|nr:TetR family transcriptional regulator [Nonomuraea sp. NEAU-A123]MBT2224793.1 TetR/AcrR family transcriptional regulator [Nonomuraea sp. NEAU-A123]